MCMPIPPHGHRLLFNNQPFSQRGTHTVGIGVLCLWQLIGIRLLSTCCTSPTNSLGRSAKTRRIWLLHASVLFSTTLLRIQELGTICWDSNPHLPVLETGALPIKLRLYIIDSCLSTMDRQRTITYSSTQAPSFGWATPNVTTFNRYVLLATTVGFEPTNHGVKVRCVTASPRRNIKPILSLLWISHKTTLQVKCVGLYNNQSILYILIKHFTPDLRLANQCSRHIRSMVTINLCYKERPYSN